MNADVFCVRNLLSGLVDQTYVLSNSLVASVELAMPYSRRSPLDEWQLVKIGSICLETGELSPCEHRIIAWDTRRLPVSE